MHVITLTLFTVALLTAPVVLLLAVFGKRPDVFIGNLFRSEQPRLIFGRPDRYLRSHYVKPFLVAAYVSIGLFIAALLSVFIVGLWR